MFGHRVALTAVIALTASAAPASGATLHLKAPKEVERSEKFRVLANGGAKPHREYRVSVIYHDDDQGRCARTVAKEVTRNEHAKIFDMRKVVTDADGRFELRSPKIVGGDRQTTGKLCGYLTNENGKNRDRVVRRIAFT
jgi:hypothetical protein